ncbi:MAG: phosphonopyruvate decarboxylase [Candidatus Aminicenantales bacterium]
MIEAGALLSELVRRGRTFVAGTPCTYLKPFINRAIDDPSLAYYDAANEGDAVAMAAGAAIGGRPGLALFQNAGLGNAVNALTSLCYPFRIPVLLVVTHRGQPGGPSDEPQHELMGEITAQMLDIMRIPWEPFPQDPGAAAGVLDRAQASMAERRLPFALIMAKDSVADYELRKIARPGLQSWDFRHCAEARRPTAGLPLRHEILSRYLKRQRPEDVVVCTTGYTGRELYTLKDAANHFYMVGSMGSAASFSLGLALAQPCRRLIVFDGDGAVLMRLGNLALVGANKPAHFVHVVLDNASYESTGEQSTLSPYVCLTGIARACGYAQVFMAEDLETFERLMAGTLTGPILVHVRVRTGTLPNLGRPKIKPYEVKERLMTLLGVA